MIDVLWYGLTGAECLASCGGARQPRGLNATLVSELFRAVCDEMRGSRCYLIASSRFKRKLIIGITRSNAKCAARGIALDCLGRFF